MSFVGTQIRFIANDDTLITTIDNNTNRGAILDTTAVWDFVGGLETMRIIIDRKVDVPFFSNMRLQLWQNGTHYFTGYIATQPDVESNNEQITIDCKGLSQRLKEIVVNDTFTSTTLDVIAGSFTTEYSDVGIVYSGGNNNLPATSVSSWDVKNKPLYDVLNQIILIANKDYLTTQYYWTIDKDRNIIFDSIDTVNDLQKNLFEGYNFQDPIVDSIDSVINKLKVFRAKNTSTNETELVNTYDDTNSQGQFGIKERKILFPDYADTTTINNIANAILERFQVPEKRINIKEYSEQTLLDYGYYGLSIKPDDYYFLINNMNDISNWNTTNLINTVATNSQNQVFIGGQNIKIDLSSGSSSEFMTYTLPTKIIGPQKVRFYIYYDTVVANLQVEVIDSDGNSLLITPENTLNNDNWIKIEAAVESTLFNDIYEVKLTGPGAIENYDINIGSGLDTYGILYGSSNYIRDIASVKITFLDNNVRTLYLGYLDCFSRVWAYNRLRVLKSTYKFKNNYFTSDIEFGEKQDSLIDEFVKETMQGNLAFDIYSKQ